MQINISTFVRQMLTLFRHFHLFCVVVVVRRSFHGILHASILCFFVLFLILIFFFIFFRYAYKSQSNLFILPLTD